MPIGFDERLDLLQRVARGWLELKRATDGFDDEALATTKATGAWSVKDLMIHLAIWDEELTRVLLDLERGEPEEWPSGSGAERDAWNEARVAEFHVLAVGDARDMFEEAHFDLMEVLERSPSVTTALVEPTIRHYAAHLADLKRLRRSGARR